MLKVPILPRWLTSENFLRVELLDKPVVQILRLQFVWVVLIILAPLPKSIVFRLQRLQRLSAVYIFLRE
jgi:hypothetical protein